MAQNSGDLVRALDNFSRKAFYIQAQPFVYSADKDKRLEVLKRQTEGSSAKREEWLAAQAAEAEAAKAEREKINEQLKLIKAEREKEKLEKQQAAKQDKALAKEKAALEKEEKRIQAIENLAIKREKEKEKIIEQAKKKAEQRAMADVRRKEQVREREEKIRRGIIERAEKEKTRKELEVLKKQVYEERLKELALDAEVKRLEEEALAAEAKRAAEAQQAKMRAEKEAYEEGMKQFRRAAIKLEAERKLEALAARKKQQAEEFAQQPVTPRFVNPEKSRATAEWAASQNPRLAAGHPNANPLRNTYVEDDEISQASEKRPSTPKDPALSQQVNHTLLKLVQYARERLEVEKHQANKDPSQANFRTPGTTRRVQTQQGSVRHPERRRQQFDDSPLFASHDDYDNNENTNLQEDIPAGIDDTDDKGRSETSSIAYVARKARLAREVKRTFIRDTSVDSSNSQSNPAKRYRIAHSSTDGTPHSPSTKSLSHSFIAAAAAHHQEIDSQALLQLLCKSKNFVKEKDKPDTFAIRPRREGHTMYLTTLPAISGCDLSRVGNTMTTTRREALPDFQSPDEKGKWIMTNCLYAIQVLSTKAHDEGYNALVKLKAYEGITTPDEEGVDFLVSGIPAVVASEESDLVLRPFKQPTHVQTSKAKQQLPKPKHNQPGSHAPRQQQNQQDLHMQSETSKKQHKRHDSYLDDYYH